MGKRNTQDVQVGSIPWERETHRIYRLGAFLGKGKHTGCTGWEHSLGKGNTQDVKVGSIPGKGNTQDIQVGSIPWKGETNRMYRLGAFLGKEKHTGYTGWEHSLGKGNTWDLQVGIRSPYTGLELLTLIKVN